jgi:hypothetical protein
MVLQDLLFQDQLCWRNSLVQRLIMNELLQVLNLVIMRGIMRSPQHIYIVIELVHTDWKTVFIDRYLLQIQVRARALILIYESCH